MGARFSGMTPSDKALLVASPGAGQGLALFQALLEGAAVYPFDVRTAGLPALRDWIAAEEITLYQSVPAVFRSLVKTFRPARAFRACGSSGSEATPCGARTWSSSSATSASRAACGSATEAPRPDRSPATSCGATTSLPSGPVPVGSPYEGVEVRLLDEDGREAGPDEVGEITVRSRHLALGYWRQEALTRERFLPDPAGGAERICRTGDLGQLRPDGLLVHRGRKDFQVKIRGNRVEVGEVEEALRTLPGIEDAAVAAARGTGRRESPRRLRGVERAVRLHAGASRRALADAAGSHGAGRVRLPPRPSADGAGQGGSRRPEGLPSRRARRAEGELVDPRDDVEKELVVIWEGLLGIRPIGVRHDFFELGGDSLLAVELFALIESRMGRYLPLSSFLHASTIELLAKKLREAPPRDGPASSRCRPSDPGRRSSA